MSFKINERNDNRYIYFQMGTEKTVFLAKEGQLSKKPENVLAALDYAKKYVKNYSDLEIRLLKFMPEPQKGQYISKHLKELDKQIEQELKQLPDTSQTEYKERKIKQYRESLRKNNQEIMEFIFDKKLNPPSIIEKKITLMLKNILESHGSGKTFTASDFAKLLDLSRVKTYRMIAELTKNDILNTIYSKEGPIKFTINKNAGKIILEYKLEGELAGENKDEGIRTPSIKKSKKSS